MLSSGSGPEITSGGQCQSYGDHVLPVQRVRNMAKHYHPFGTYHFIVGSQIRTPPHQKPQLAALLSPSEDTLTITETSALRIKGLSVLLAENASDAKVDATQLASRIHCQFHLPHVCSAAPICPKDLPRR